MTINASDEPSRRRHSIRVFLRRRRLSRQVLPYTFNNRSVFFKGRSPDECSGSWQRNRNVFLDRKRRLERTIARIRRPRGPGRGYNFGSANGTFHSGVRKLFPKSNSSRKQAEPLVHRVLGVHIQVSLPIFVSIHAFAGRKPPRRAASRRPVARNFVAKFHPMEPFWSEL